MKLHYFDGTKDAGIYAAKNFGDELNLWLWPKVIPKMQDSHSDTIFVGMGTLLNQRLVSQLPSEKTKIVMGTGVGYGETPTLDNSWKVYFLRGPLSAISLSLDSKFGITDPAILVKKFVESRNSKRYAFSYMPHYIEAIINGEAWTAICNELDIYYIDPRKSLEAVIEDILDTKILLAEAMHGAIVADALRVPWIPIKTHSRILDFKWKDWLSNLSVPYQPIKIHRKSSNLTREPLLKYFDYQLVKLQFSKAKKSKQIFLSTDDTSNDLLKKVESQIDCFIGDFF